MCVGMGLDEGTHGCRAGVRDEAVQETVCPSVPPFTHRRSSITLDGRA
jgi:hypothetical protein